MSHRAAIRSSAGWGRRRVTSTGHRSSLTGLLSLSRGRAASVKLRRGDPPGQPLERLGDERPRIVERVLEEPEETDSESDDEDWQNRGDGPRRAILGRKDREESIEA